MIDFKATLSHENPAALTMDGFDEAIVGIGRRCGCPSLAIYDYNKIIMVLERSMTREEAMEYYEHNIAGSYMGDNTPIVVTLDPSFSPFVAGWSSKEGGWDA